MTPMWNTDLLESVSENLDVIFVIKEFPADKQFVIWWLNLEQWESMRRVFTKEMLDDIGVRLVHTPRNHWSV
jgi:hypothetical protein